MNGEIVQFEEGSGAMSLYRTPDQAIADARRCAVALKQVMLEKPHPVFFPDGSGGKEQYLECEDWGLVAAFHGCTPKILETQYVDYGPAGKGFKAVAVLVDRNGIEVSRAESMCLDSEDTWGMVSEYAWVDKLDKDGNKIWNPRGGKEGRGAYDRERVKIGEKPKPMFQLMSMAQTRTISKVISTKFRYIAVLAGYASTPAEDMTGKEHPPEPEPDKGPDIQPKSQRNPPPPAPPPPPPPPKQTANATPDPPENAPEPAIRPRSQKEGTQPSPAAQKPQGTPSAPQQQANNATADPGELLISEKQGKMMFAISRSVGMDDAMMKQVLANIGFTGHRDQLPRRLFQQALAGIDPEFRFHSRDQGR